MKKFLTAVAVAFFLLTTVAHAARVQIYDHSVNDILNDIKETSKYMKNDKKYANVNLAIRGTHYYTGTDGFKYCESHFGDNDQNRLIFQVNNNGAVSSAWVISRLDTLSGNLDEDGMKAMGLSVASIFDYIGMSKDEGDKLLDGVDSWTEANFRKALESLNALRRNDTRLAEQKMNEVVRVKTFSVWCAKAKRYVNVEASVNNLYSDAPTTFNLFIYAHT